MLRAIGPSDSVSKEVIYSLNIPQKEEGTDSAAAPQRGSLLPISDDKLAEAQLAMQLLNRDTEKSS
jgi:hypothetical protein